MKSYTYYLTLILASFISSAYSDSTTLNSLEERVRTLEYQLERREEASSQKQIQIGSYGELHYNNLENQQDKKKDELDLHRFVMFFGYQYTPKIRFISEVEIEHALSGDGKSGEVEIEQAYVEFLLSENTKINLGVMLLPIGILNEDHEPTKFFGVERNPIEKHIIPSTWWSSAVSLTNYFLEDKAQIDIMLHEGLQISENLNIRKGRQKSSKAKAEDLAITTRLKYTPSNHIKGAVTYQYQDDFSQGSDFGGSAQLFEAHGTIKFKSLTLKGLYASWNLDSEYAKGLNKDKQKGGYIEASYKIIPQLGIFYRLNTWEVEKGIEQKQHDFGLNYYPHENIVIKFDIQNQNQEAGNWDGFNLGMGYHF